MARRPGHLRGRALLLYYSPAYSQASGAEHYAPPSFPGKRPGQVFTYDGQQDAAGVSAGGPETHVMRPKGDGATAVTARTARQRLEREERPQVMAPPPWGLRVLTFWTSDLSGPSWQKERGTRSQGEEKRNPDASSAHASTLCPAPQFPSVASARRPDKLDVFLLKDSEAKASVADEGSEFEGYVGFLSGISPAVLDPGMFPQSRAAALAAS
ncbi:hypothetical protein MJT46_015775 [Ovis ammon polii x Ovis aries]|nr:hypothetical protein MJT46_015775 [Ovis ammon polii x Ovis aries]